MKVYTASKLKKSIQPLNQVIRGNIQQLASLLKSHSTPSLSLSPSNQSLNAQEEAISLAKYFISNLSDPYQCMLLYPLMIDCSITQKSDSLFLQTEFPDELHPLLSLYLRKCSVYPQLQRNNRKAIDLFYRFLGQQAPEVFDEWLERDDSRTLGQWFYMECITGFFQLLFKEKDQFTIFITNFLRLGLPYLLLSSVSALKNKKSPPECQNGQLDRIRARYVQKYKMF